MGNEEQVSTLVKSEMVMGLVFGKLQGRDGIYSLVKPLLE